MVDNLTSEGWRTEIMGERQPPVYLGQPVSGRILPAPLLWREAGKTNPQLAEKLLHPGVAPEKDWRVGDLTQAEKIDLLKEFLAQRFNKVCLNYHVVAPGNWADYKDTKDVERDLKEVYPLFEPLVRRVLEGRPLMPEQVRICHDHIGIPRILPVDAGTERASLPVQIQDFGSPFQFFCQCILDINASRAGRPVDIRWCPSCRKPWPEHRNPKALGCTPECSKELKRQKDKERYRKRKGIIL